MYIFSILAGLMCISASVQTSMEQLIDDKTPQAISIVDEESLLREKSNDKLLKMIECKVPTHAMELRHANRPRASTVDKSPQCRRKLMDTQLSIIEGKEESQIGAQLLELPENMIIFEIAKGLVNYADYVRFRSTCKSLQYMLPKTPNHQLSQVPWLMLPHNKDQSGKCRNFFSPLENMMYNFDIPKIQGKLLRGSSHGWLFAHDGFPELYLINPFTKAQIRLPPVDTFPDVLWYRPDMIDEEYLIFRERLYLSKPPIIKSASISYFRRAFLRKVILSASPTSDEYIAMAIYGEFAELAFCRSGDKKWTRYRRNDPEEPDFYFDIISHEGKFYVLNERGEIWVGDGTSLPKMTQLAPSFPPRSLPGYCWLVRMTSGEFVVLNMSQKWKTISHNSEELLRYETTHFRIFKFDKKELKWSKITSIGNDAFFIGMNSSLSFSSQNLPIGWRGNCIYFTDAYTEGHHERIIGGYDNGVYNLENKRVESLPGFVFNSLLVWPPPIWVTPIP